MKVNQETA